MNHALLSKYRDKLRAALSLKDVGGYNLAASEMNPVIFEEFISILFDRQLPPVVWEPFAGRSQKSRIIDIAEDNGVRMISQTLHPRDPRIRVADSTVVGPGETIGGVLFHPPYFGAVPFSADERDVCHTENKLDYIAGLEKVVSLAAHSLVPQRGFVCAVGRDYRVGGQRVQLAEWYLEVFDPRLFELEEVWLSEPDVALIFRMTI